MSISIETSRFGYPRCLETSKLPGRLASSASNRAMAIDALQGPEPTTSARNAAAERVAAVVHGPWLQW